MDTQTGILGWVIAGVGTIVTTLSGLVAMFYQQQIRDYKATEIELKNKVLELEARADKCEQDREALRISQARLEERVAMLERTTQAGGR